VFVVVYIHQLPKLGDLGVSSLIRDWKIGGTAYMQKLILGRVCGPGFIIRANQAKMCENGNCLSKQRIYWINIFKYILNSGECWNTENVLSKEQVQLISIIHILLTMLNFIFLKYS
jgi:hypothetical protein